MGRKGLWVYRNNYKGYMDKTKVMGWNQGRLRWLGWVEWGEKAGTGT